MTTLSIVWLAAAAHAGPKASSSATSNDGVAHPASHAFDGLLATAWAEGEMGEGQGSWLEVRFDRPVDVGSISIWPGWLGGVNRDLKLHGRPRNVTITFDVAGGEDVVIQEVLLDPGEEGPLRHDAAVEAPKTVGMRITVDEVYPGGIYSDMYIAEVALNLTGGAPPGPVTGVRDWMKSESGARMESDHNEKAQALIDKINTEQFGDSDSLKTLMDWAADGAPYLRRRVSSRVPAGFRINALRPDEAALNALLRLQDPNGIPAIERAALRTTGKVSTELRKRAKMFDAFADLKGGQRNIPPWGTAGFGKGAFQTFGEPLNLAIDDYGGVWLADTANHRVQRLGVGNGLFEQAWGSPKTELTDFWFYRKRDPYPAGAAPGTSGDQAFVLPVDVEVQRGKKGDHTYVLDYAAEPDSKGPYGRITHITPDGNVAHREKLPFTNPIGPKAGGEGHLVVVGKKVIAIWANQGVEYRLPDWERGQVFSLEDGSASGAIALKGGKVGLVYGQDLVMYSTDGFRHGSVLGEALLGAGYEDWGLAYDERGKLWAVLDNGEVFKLKGLKKVDFKIRVADVPTPMPRIAAYDDHVYVTTGNRIIQGDALEMLSEQTEEAPARENLDVGGGQP